MIFTLIQMFSTNSQLKKRTPENGTDRENYLTLLVDEYLHSNSIYAKRQVVANLANFAYDPINFGFIRDVGVLDIFLHVLKHETDVILIQFCSAGICNLCNDPLNAEYILANGGLRPIIHLLRSDHNDIIADAITTLIYMADNQTNSEIVAHEIIELVGNHKNSEDRKLSNLATIFLKDVCGKD